MPRQNLGDPAFGCRVTSNHSSSRECRSVNIVCDDDLPGDPTPKPDRIFGKDRMNVIGVGAPTALRTLTVSGRGLRHNWHGRFLRRVTRRQVGVL
jgi:hypothetical protein